MPDRRRARVVMFSQALSTIKNKHKIFLLFSVKTGTSYTYFYKESFLDIMSIHTYTFCSILFFSVSLHAQNNAIIKEYKQSFPTYAFSDPNPMPLLTQVYPYFRYDGFTDKPVQKEWKVVELENDYIKLMILPEIGGKIWSAVEKSTGKPFIYYNHAIKFRDIAMRGPWTSGGIEFSHGIGLHVGEFQFGNIGSLRRMDFTVIGNEVNVAARIEAQCSSRNANLLMSEAFVTQSGVAATLVAKTPLKGIAGDFALYAPE